MAISRNHGPPVRKNLLSANSIPGSYPGPVPNRHLFGQVLDAIHSDPRYEIIPAEQPTLDAASALYRQRPDKDWSLTDCTSFVLMRQRIIAEALTADRHFEQADFTPLF
jgi:predicted nucleic acid-binding protein